MYRHYVFDIDGTLIDSEAAAIPSLHQVAVDLLGQDLPAEHLYQAFGMSADDTMRWLGIADVERGHKLWNHYFADYRHLITVFDGILPVLDALKAKGASLGLLTSKNRYEYEHDFLPLGLEPRFDTVILADDSETHKPQAGPMLAYLAKSGAKPEEVLFIGDSVHVMGCGKNAGVDHALALWGRRSDDPSIEATYRLHTPAELLSL